jgi:metal-responsive CopG/Arc/MetJ family transcriptional regulator
MAQKKIQISLPPAIAEEVDDYCKLNDLNRSGFFTMAAVSYINAHHAVSLMGELLNVLKSIQRDGVSLEELQEMENIERMLSVLTARTE